MEAQTQRELLRTDAIRTLHNSIAAHCLTVVTAPAGYGKTALAQRLTGKKIRQRLFHSVPEEIANVDHWWDSLFANMAHQGMDHAAALRRIGFPRNPSMTKRAIELLENSAHPFLLIIDDLHNFSDIAIDKFLESVIRAEPANHRFVLFSRVKPRMSLNSLAQAGLAATHTQALLKFTEADAVRFFFLNGVPDRNAAKQAWRYSEGWITALWLCLLNKKTGNETSPSKDIENLLDEAVFSRHSPAERDFLMMLSVLGSLTESEAEALTLRVDTSSLLRDMSNGIAFIRRDDSGGHYVLHSIFRAFLEKKLAACKKVNTPELYRRAAECHIRRKDSMPAFRLLVKAGRDEDLLRILEVVFSDGQQSIFTVKREEFLPILEKIPWRLRIKQPLGYLLLVWLCFDDEINDPLSVALFEEMATRFTRSRTIPAHLRRRLAGELEFMRGWIYTAAEPELLAPRYENALKLLGGPSIIRYERRCWNIGCPHVLFVYLPSDAPYLELADLVARACGPMRRLTSGVIEGCDYVCRAEYHLERGDFEEAARVVDDLDQLIDFPRNMSSLIMARFLRARLLSLESATEKAAAILADILHDIEATESSEHIQCAELALGYILANYGLPDAAPRWLRDGDIFERPYGATRIRGFMTTICGKLLLAKGDMDGLAAFLSERPDIFGPGGSTFGSIHAAAFNAMLAWHRREEDAALAALREALRHSRPDGFILPLAEYGRHILPLLRRLEKDEPGNALLQKTVCLAEQVAAVQRRNENKAKRALTTEESGIMRLVAKGKSSDAIATKLGIAESRVKYSLSRAYKKLGAKNRAEAARLFQRSSEKRPSRNTVEAGQPEIPPEMRHAKQALSAKRFVDADEHRLMRLAEESIATKLSEEDRFNPSVRDSKIGDGLAGRGDLPDAFTFYLRAGRDGDLRRALELFQLPASGKMLAYCYEEVCAAVRLFPWSARLARPRAYLSFLWRYFRVFDRGTTALDLDEAEYRLSADVSKNALAGDIVLLRSLTRAHDVRELFAGHDAALALLGGPSRLYSRETSWTFGNPHFTFAVVREGGEFAALENRLAAASATLSALSGGMFSSLDAAFRMERHLERGETAEAAALLPELEARDDDMQSVILAAFARARLLLAEGRPDMAVDVLERLVPRTQRFDSFEHSTSLDLARGFIYAHLGRPDDVAPWIKAGETASPPHGAMTRCAFASVAQGKYLLAIRDFARLESAARTLPTRLCEYDSLLGRIHAKVLEALAAEYYRRGDEALARLREAVELSRPDGLTFSIAEYGGLVLPLLHSLRRGAPGDRHLRQITMLAEQRRRHGAAGKTGVRDKHILTSREREIMRLVARGKSNAAIAEELNLSDSRIIKALSKIYNKLGVSNRAEAAKTFDIIHESKENF